MRVYVLIGYAYVEAYLSTFQIRAGEIEDRSIAQYLPMLMELL